MKTNHSTFLFLSVLLALALVSCAPGSKAPATPLDPQDAKVLVASGIPGDGDVFPIGLMDTLRYLNGVVNGTIPGSFILTDADGANFVFFWPMKARGYGFFGISGNGSLFNVLKSIGNFSNTFTTTDLVKTLEDHNWHELLDKSQLPPWMIYTITTTSTFLRVYGTVITTVPMIIVLPGGNLDLAAPGIVGKD